MDGEIRTTVGAQAVCADNVALSKECDLSGQFVGQPLIVIVQKCDPLAGGLGDPQVPRRSRRPGIRRDAQIPNRLVLCLKLLADARRSVAGPVITDEDLVRRGGLRECGGQRPLTGLRPLEG